MNFALLESAWKYDSVSVDAYIAMKIGFFLNFKFLLKRVALYL